MTTATGLSEQQRTYLDVLAIAHYVYAALIGFVGLVMLLMASIGMMGFTLDGVSGMDRGMGMGMGRTGCLPSVLIGIAFLLVVAMAVVNFLAGRWLKQRRQWMAIVVVSVLNALNVPLGTLLGVITIVVLVGEDVRAAFDRSGPTVAAPPSAAPPSATGREL